MKLAAGVTVGLSILVLLAGAATARRAALTGEIVQTDKTWVCNSAVDLHSVTVTITASAPQGQGVGVLLQRGCTGTIGRLDVTDSLDDAVKGAATSLTVSDGAILCRGRNPLAHQDGIQITGGSQIHFDSVVVDCASANDAGFFVNPNAGQAPSTWPADVTFENGYLGPTLSSTAFVTDNQTDSGIVTSVICPSPDFTYRHHDAIDVGNVYPSAC